MTIRHIILLCALAFLTGAYVLWRDGFDFAVAAMMSFVASVGIYELDHELERK